jgi:hypothetical protein
MDAHCFVSLDPGPGFTLKPMWSSNTAIFIFTEFFEHNKQVPWKFNAK